MFKSARENNKHLATGNTRPVATQHEKSMKYLHKVFPFVLSAVTFFSIRPVRPNPEKAAKSIWRVSRNWLYDAKTHGTTGKSHETKVHLNFTGKLKGRVATYRADFQFPSGGKKCRVTVRGSIEKGSYKRDKIPIINGVIRTENISSTCSLPDRIKKTIQNLSIPLKLGLVQKRLCATMGSEHPGKSRDCFVGKK